jgi:hypothetical protein
MTDSFNYPRHAPVPPRYDPEFDPKVEHRDHTPVVPEDVQAEEEFIDMMNRWPGTEKAQQSNVLEEFLESKLPQADPTVWAGTDQVEIVVEDAWRDGKPVPVDSVPTYEVRVAYTDKTIWV